MSFIYSVIATSMYVSDTDVSQVGLSISGINFLWGYQLMNLSLLNGSAQYKHFRAFEDPKSTTVVYPISGQRWCKGLVSANYKCSPFVKF